MENDLTFTDLAKRVFGSYCAAVSGVAHTGKPIPAWDELPDHVQQGWIDATQTALSGYERVQMDTRLESE